MTQIANARINTFGPSPKADFESPSEQLITLTCGRLQNLIKGAIEQAIEPLQNEIDQLQAEITSLHAKLASLESLQEQDTSRICLDIAYDRRRLAALEKVELQPMQKDRGEILRALLVANGGKMLAKEARQKMHLGKEQFSLLISKMDEYIETKQFHQDRRQLVLIIK